MVTINGKEEDAAGKSMSDYIAETCMDQARIAVELNGSILPKSDYAKTVLSDGDMVEIVNFVGGG